MSSHLCPVVLRKVLSSGPNSVHSIHYSPQFTDQSILSWSPPLCWALQTQSFNILVGDINVESTDARIMTTIWPIIPTHQNPTSCCLPSGHLLQTENSNFPHILSWLLSSTSSSLQLQTLPALAIFWFSCLTSRILTSAHRFWFDLAPVNKLVPAILLLMALQKSRDYYYD